MLRLGFMLLLYSTRQGTVDTTVVGSQIKADYTELVECTMFVLRTLRNHHTGCIASTQC